MLTSLHVKNLALIDEAEIDFGEGLNILTGETGAGKSVLIGSINLALGEKADVSVIRDGAEYALIEMVFHIDDSLLSDAIREMELPTDEDGSLILQRKLMKNRSVCKVNGENVTLKQLRELSRLLITIHGQNDQLSLLSQNNQKQILDQFDEPHTSPLKKKISDCFSLYQEQKRQFEEADIDERTRLREMDLISYELNEIEEANLTAGEDEQLESDFKKLSNHQKIAEAVSAAKALLSSGETTIADLIGEAVRRISPVSSMDQNLNDIFLALQDLESLTHDTSREIDDYLSDINADEEKLDEIASRLNLVNRLKEKYGHGTDRLQAVLDYAENRRQELEKLKDLEEFRARAAANMEQTFAELCRYADELTDVRRAAGSGLSALLEQALKHLNFENVRFETEIDSDHAHINADGADEITFMISLNPGEKLRPLHKVSSGGELSRIMLAIKTVLSENKESMAMIFDEIDAGISGKTAWRVSQKLGKLAKDRQVICITHLPQIAAMADTHFEIYKESSSGRNITHIRKLTEEMSVQEIARLIGTDDADATSLQAAGKLRKEAAIYKNTEMS